MSTNESKQRRRKTEPMPKSTSISSLNNINGVPEMSQQRGGAPGGQLPLCDDESTTLY